MPRIEIATSTDDRAALGRPLMSDHNLSARVWATAALVSVPFVGSTSLAWWLPLHLLLLGAVTQAIVGGQLMFSATLGLSRGPSRRTVLAQLALLNVGAALVIGGRYAGAELALGIGAALVTLAIGWVLWLVDRLWRRSINRRFAITGTFYRMAGASILIGASIGGALGIGAFDDPSSYIAHRTLHMTVNVLGWVGLTVVGTAVTLLPTVLHVRAPDIRRLRGAPWLMFGGLLTFATGASLDSEWVGAAGMTSYAIGLAILGTYLKAVLVTPRRRRFPTAGLHLVGALAWLGVTTAALVVTSAAGDPLALRDFVVVGGAAGFAFQALLGAWSFLLPSTRAPIPERRRRELVTMELGGRVQVVVYNVGLLAVLLGLRADLGTAHAGMILAWSAATWALFKLWTFPWLAAAPAVHTMSASWWAPPESDPPPSKTATATGNVKDETDPR